MEQFALGCIVGFLAHRALTMWRACWRICCREHYASHAQCTCRDCVEDREAA